MRFDISLALLFLVPLLQRKSAVIMNLRWTNDLVTWQLIMRSLLRCHRMLEWGSCVA